MNHRNKSGKGGATVADTRRRAVRSYVLRSGRMTPGQRRAMDTLWPKYGLSTQDGLLDLTAIFGRKTDRILEIGFGNGENLVSMAADNPQLDFIGIEVHEPGVGHCLLAASNKDIGNLRVLREDAVEVLKNNIPDAALARVNLFFPDPWHKKRHHKRRIVQPDFLDLLAAKLQPAGIFHVATDWPDYAEHIDALLSGHSGFDPLAAPPHDRIVTRFDNRGARLGHKNWERAWCTRSNLAKR